MLIVVSRVTNDILIGGEKENRDHFNRQSSEKYKIETIVHMPGTINLLGFVVSQDPNYQITVHADQKLSELQSCSISCSRRK